MPKGPPKPHVLQLRLTDVQRRYLLFKAGVTEQHMSDVVRGLIEQSLDRERVDTDDSDLPDDLRGGKLPLRSLLGFLDESGIEDAARRYGT